MIVLVLFFVASSGSGNQGGTDQLVPVRLTENHNNWSANRIFEILYNDRRCIPWQGESSEEIVIISSGQVRGGFFECKQNCMLEKICAFFALWKRGKCELYSSCFRTTDMEYQQPEASPKSPKKIVENKVYKRLSECDVEVNHSKGRYSKSIAQAFPDNLVRNLPPRQNLHCFCITGRWAVCAIFVVEDSEEEALVHSIIAGPTPRPPFMMNPMMSPDDAPVIFALPPEDSPEPRVYAEVYAMNFDRCLHLTMCTDGGMDICPLMKTPYQSGEPVVLLKSDAARVNQKQPVLCISLSGIMQISMSIHPQTNLVVFNEFRDPLNRNPEKRMHFKTDYDVYFLFDDKDYQKGLCSEDAAAASDFLPDLSSMRLQGSPSSAASDTSSLDTSSSLDGSSPAFKKKTRRGGKKKRGSVLPPSLEGSPDAHDTIIRPPPSILKRPSMLSDPGSSSAADALLSAHTSPSSTSPTSGGAKKVQFTSLPDNVPMRSPTGERKISKERADTNLPFLSHSWIFLMVLCAFIFPFNSIFHRNHKNVYISFDDVEKG